MKKQCSRCLKTKLTTEFHKQIRVSSGLQSICKQCRKEWDAELYQKNKKRRKGQYKAIRAKVKANHIAIKENNPCTDCGKYYPYYVMHWDHLPGYDKITAVSRLVGNSCNIKIKEEIAKCELVCANCHAERTHVRQQYTK